MISSALYQVGFLVVMLWRPEIYSASKGKVYIIGFWKSSKLFNHSYTNVYREQSN